MVTGKQVPFSEMTIIVDSNILVSALITPNGKLAEILSKPNLSIKRISTNYLVTEILQHQAKIAKSAGRTIDELVTDLQYYLRFISLYDDTVVAPNFWIEADRLTIGVDSKDINFVALALQTDGWLWTGDKKLSNHLKIMGFDRVLNTTELYEKLGTI